MREMDISRPSQRVRVTSELVTTTASSAPDSATRSMSLVRRVRGCSKLPETQTSRPSTCMVPTTSGLHLSAFRRQHNWWLASITGLPGYHHDDAQRTPSHFTYFRVMARTDNDT